MQIALAAAPVDFKRFDWFKVKTPFKLDVDPKRKIDMEVGQFVGLNLTSSGPTAGKYQIVTAHLPQWVFRGVDPEHLRRFTAHLTHYEGVPERQSTNGKRVSGVSLEKRDRHNAQFYVCPEKISELTGYDKEHYQWRTVSRKTAMHAAKSGKLRMQLDVGDLVGVRYVSKSKGGYVILPNGERLHIDHESYSDLTLHSKILHKQDQPRGHVVYEEMADNLRRPPIKKSKDQIGNTPVVKDVDSLKSTIDWGSDDFDFDDEEDEDIVSEHINDLKADDIDESRDAHVNGDETNASVEHEEDEEEIELEFEDENDSAGGENTVNNNPEDDHKDDEDFSEDGTPVNGEDEEVEAGLILETKSGETWYVLDVVHDSAFSSAMKLYSPKTKKVISRRASKDDIYNSRFYSVIGSLSSKDLKEAREESGIDELSAE